MKKVCEKYMNQNTPHCSLNQHHKIANSKRKKIYVGSLESHDRFCKRKMNTAHHTIMSRIFSFVSQYL